MGNFSDAELLICDEELSDIDIDGATDDIYGMHIGLKSYKDIYTLKPQHLLFDGLDEEYCFDMFADAYDNGKEYKFSCIPEEYIWNPEDKRRFSRKDEDVESSYYEAIVDVIDDPNITSVHVYDIHNRADVVDCEDGVNYIVDDSNVWCIDDFKAIRNWQSHNNMDTSKIDRSIKEYHDEELVVHEDDVYHGLYYEDLEHRWEMPERDEMDDLQEKVEALYLD